MPANTPPRQINIDITSDSICPWCFLGKRKLDQAIEIALNKGLNVQVNTKFHPYLLDPSLTIAKDKREHYVKKFGKERFQQMEQRMNLIGKDNGINFSYHGKLGPTIDSHRLIAYSYDKGGQTTQLDFVEKLFNGYFEREQDVSDRNFLSAQAVEAGLFSSADEAKAWLQSDAKQQEVSEGILKAQAQGITGVPFFLVDGKYAISGAQDPSVFVGIFEKLVSSKDR